jgi:hypothetical protein
MFDINSLNTYASYLVSSNPGQWRYSRRRGTKYHFWRFDVNRRETLSLTPQEVQTQVWQEVQTVDLSKLEAFRGE